MRGRRRVAVIGGAQPSAQERAWAEAVGRELGRRDAILVCGGRGGVMEAACRGAQATGGFTVGILPGTSREEANPYVDLPLVTGLGEARNLLVVRNAQAAIAVGGGYGTLSEIAFALRLGLPVVGLGTWELQREGLEVELVTATTPEEAVAWVWQNS
ncbi:MAG: TIGR00725 family protein [Anaerolineales bacterium]